MAAAEPTLAQYADELYGGEDKLLRSMREEAVAAGIPSIQVPDELGRMLSLLVRSSGAARILEVGGLFGYSAVLLARALPAHGALVSLEIDPDRANLVRSNVRRAGLDARVTVLEGPAGETLATLTAQRFDFVFIDADKASYPEYLEWAIRLTSKGAIIVADNVWREGRVLHDTGGADAGGAARYNATMAQDTRFQTTLLPTRGGADAASISVRIRD